MMFENPMSGLGQLQKPVKMGKIEPWMADFVKERHSQEEWEAFFAYCEAGPVKRALCAIAGVLISIIPIARKR